MRTIGLTGGIATGKSTVAGLLREEHNQSVLDADALAREVVEPDKPAHKEILEAFGSEVFQADGRIDRPNLRSVISRSVEARQRLEAITHPRILARMLERLTSLSQQGASLAFVEAALLVETGSYASYDELWVVTCTSELQLQRLMERDSVSQHDALAMIQTQLPLHEKEALADRVLQNSGTFDDLRLLVTAAMKALDC